MRGTRCVLRPRAEPRTAERLSEGVLSPGCGSREGGTPPCVASCVSGHRMPRHPACPPRAGYAACTFARPSPPADRERPGPSPPNHWCFDRPGHVTGCPRCCRISRDDGVGVGSSVFLPGGRETRREEGGDTALKAKSQGRRFPSSAKRDPGEGSEPEGRMARGSHRVSSRRGRTRPRRLPAALRSHCAPHGAGQETEA